MATSNNGISLQEARQTGQITENYINYSPAPNYDYLIGGIGLALVLAAVAIFIVRLIRKKKTTAIQTVEPEASPELNTTSEPPVLARRFNISVTALLIVVTLLGLGMIAYATVNHVRRDDTQNGQTTFASNSSTKYDDSLSDILPIQPESKGDIPQFVAKLRQAKSSKDTSICNSLPTPQQQDFFFDDYSLSSPSRSEWVNYCTALVKNDPVICKSIQGYGHPNLQQACLTVLEKEVQKNTDYTYCYEKFGTFYTSSDELSACFQKYQGQLATAPDIYRNLNTCLKKSSEPANYIGSERDKCLYELAVSSKQVKICNIIDTEYAAYKYGRPNCISAVPKQ
jgi:hypothetical protein